MLRRFGFSAYDLLAVGLATFVTLTFLSAKADLPPDRSFLGFVHVDQIVYYANARETFENGTGLTYATPYSMNPESPRVYSHFSFLIFAYLWKLLGLSFTTIDYALRVVFGSAMLMLAIRIFRRAIPFKRFAPFGAVAAVSAGGLAWAIALIQLLQSYALNRSDPGFEMAFGQWLANFPDDFARVEGGYGEWHLNLLRNLTYTPETMYHTWFLAAILCLVKKRPMWASLFVALTWWSHPFTGAELGLITGVYLAVEVALGRRRWIKALALVAALDLLFMLYYLVFLRLFDEHVSVEDQVRGIGNPMLTTMLLPAYGLFLVLPAFYLPTRKFRVHLKRSAPVRLFFVWLVCALVLVFNDRLLFFTRPTLPLHFSHGYLYLPLVFFSACGLRRILGRLRAVRKGWATAALAILLLAHLPDNFYWFGQLRRSLASRVWTYSISKENEELLARLDEIEGPLQIHAVGLPPAYNHFDAFVPLLTRHRSLVPHPLNAPFYKDRRDAAATLAREFTRPALEAAGLTAVAIARDDLARLEEALGPGNTQILFEHGDVLIVRLAL